MERPATWNPLTEWKHRDIRWVKVDLAPEELRRFTERSDVKGAFQTLGFLLVVAATGTLAYQAFAAQRWVLLALALVAHGTVYGHFGDALHELGHRTVFATQSLNTAATVLYGWLYWPWNPHLYRLSHQNFHHRYTLHQGSDGEDVPNYVELKPRLIAGLFLNVLHPVSLVQNLARLLTLKPTSKGWRGRGYALDTWERFVLDKAPAGDRRAVRRFAWFSLISHAAFVAACLISGFWFLPIVITLAPFYGAGFHSFLCAAHQHAACEANHPDFRVSCGDAKLDPLSSFLYWHMEYHTEHHMFAAIPCYNLKRFRSFAASQLPPLEPALPRLLKLHALCKRKYGSWQAWRDAYGRYKGF